MMPSGPGRPWRSLSRLVPPLFGVAALIAALAVVMQFWEPAPPDRVVMSTGPEGGAYEPFARRYRAALARHGVTLELRTSSGAVENLARLRDPDSDVEVAIVQSGLPHDARDERLMSLGNLFLEPVWLFVPAAQPIDDVRQLAGRRIAIGGSGSGTHAIASAALRMYGFDQPPTRMIAIGGPEAGRALRGGGVDAAFFVGAPDSPAIATLLRDPDVRLVSVQRADAFVRRMPVLSKVVLPAGVIDPATDVPARDVTLVATTAMLVARDRLHPVIVDLLVEAAREVHSEGTILNAPGVFPNPTPGAFALSPDAERYYRDGPGLLRRYLPTWAAVWAQRLLFVGIPLIAIFGPLLHFAPRLWSWQMRRRIYRWYGELKLIEAAVRDGRGDAAAQLRRLGEIDERLKRLRTPNSFGADLYLLRSHVQFVRDLLSRQAPSAGATDGAAQV
jgi:TRAP transporter TAXI family solute receptor